MTASARWRRAAAATTILALAACGDDSNTNAGQPDSTRAAAQAQGQAQGQPKGGGVAESRGDQLFREAERIANLGRDLEARQTFERALAAFRSAGDRAGEGRTLIALGSLDRAMGQGERGRQVLRDADAVYAAVGDNAGRAEVAVALGELERAQFNNETARRIFDQAAALYRANGDWAGEARALLGRADVERRLALILSARRSAARAGAIYTVLRDTQNATLARRTLDEVTTNYPDDDEADRQAVRDEALALEQAGDIVGEAGLLLQLAALEQRAGRVPQSREVYGRALELFAAERDTAGQVRALTGLGGLERELERWGAAATAYTGGLELARQLGDAEAEARMALGLAEVELGRGADPAPLIQQSRALFARAGNRAGDGMALTIAARAALRAGDTAQAERSLTKAQSRLAGDAEGTAHAHVALGDVQRAQGNAAAAAESYGKALAAFEEAGAKVAQAWALFGLGLAQAATSPIEAKVNLLLAAGLFQSLGIEPRRAEAAAAATAIAA